MAGPFLTRDHELFVQLEAVFGTSPGALAGTDAFKTKTRYPFTKSVARYDRDQDADPFLADVLSTQKGREHSEWTVEGDIIPSGNAATPTAPDMDQFFEAHLGEKFTCTAHTTTAAGSSGVTLNLTPGGGAASGIRTGGGDLIAIDVDATFGVEVRQVVSRSTDVVTLDRALSANPAAARNVFVGTTYRWTEAALKTLHLWGYLRGDNFRHKAGGCAPAQLEATCDFSQESPVAAVTFSGMGKELTTHATARPTPVTAGQPLLPDKAFAFVGADKQCITYASLNSNNGVELRMNESCSLFPTAAKRTGNNSRYNVQQVLRILLQTGTIEGYYDNASTLTAYDVIVQLGVAAGKIVAWRTRKFIPDVPVAEQDGEVSLELTGRCYGSAGDDSLAIAFI